MRKIVFEIDGERHKMVRTRKNTDSCCVCSLREYCKTYLGNPCYGNKNHFIKERKETKKEL